MEGKWKQYITTVYTNYLGHVDVKFRVKHLNTHSEMIVDFVEKFDCDIISSLDEDEYMQLREAIYDWLEDNE